MRALRIELIENTKCAHDVHEQTHYPKKGFIAKPELQAGTVLTVDSEWSNFYGRFYRCGNYDIPVNNAKVLEYGI